MQRVFYWALLVVAVGGLIGCESVPTPSPTPLATVTPSPTRTRTPRATRTPRPTATPSPVPAVVTDTLRVREQPSTTARVLGRLKKDTVVILLARQSDNQWYQIEYPPGSGQFGWIFAEVVQPQGDVTQLPVGFHAPAPPPGATFATVHTEGDPLRVRAGPGTTYEVITRIPDGTRILLLAKLEDGSWYQVEYPPDAGKRGWVSGEFVQPASSTTSMAIAQAPPTPTPGPTPVQRPTRAPNLPTGGTVLVESNRDGQYDIYSIGENGVVRRPLTRGGNAFGARFSPDGEQIVFYRIVSTAPNVVSHLFVIDFNGGNLRDLSRSAGSASDSDPDWSPDGKQIVFVRTPRAGAPEIWVMNADGANARRLLKLSAATGITSGGAGDYSPQPRWSPDGGRIAFTAVPRAARPGAPLYPAVFVARADGSDARQLTDNDLINTGPVWSPDGTQIVWSAKDFINRQNWRVWVMNASGTDPHILVGDLSGDSSNGVQVAAWRNNRLLLAGWTGAWNAYLARSDGTAITAITRGPADIQPTDWLP